MTDLATVDIGISVDESVPPDVLDDIVADLRSHSLTVEAERRSSTAFAAAHWYVPTFVILLLSRKLFDSFLAEAGKDLYALVKRSLVTVVNRTSGENALVRPVVVATAGKVPDGWRPPVMSAIIPLKDGRRAVFLFMPALADTLHEDAVRSMLEIARRHHAEGLALPDLGVSLDDSIGRWGSIPLVYDADAQRWRAVTSAD